MAIIMCDVPVVNKEHELNVADPGTQVVPGDGMEIRFLAGLPGFPGVRRFRIEDLGANLRPFRRMRDMDEPDIAFTVVDPGLLYPDYAVEVTPEDREMLGLESAAEAMTLVMVTVPAPPQPPTANLLGPIVVNRRTGVATQIVQHRSNYPVAEPLPSGGA